MPELPEVETVRRSLTEMLKENPEIEQVICRRKDLRFPLPLKFFSSWKGCRILWVERRAKYLLILTDIGGLVCHLGMTGNFRLIERSEERRTHDHVEFWLKGGAVLVYEDPRRFGFMLKWPGSWDKVSREPMGSEPLDEAWTAEELKLSIKGRKGPIKTLLMDQKIVVGIGNIYASEILFKSGVRPKRSAARVKLQEFERITFYSKQVLRAAIEGGGSSIRDFHSPQGADGGFQNQHQVYDREDKPCVVCSTPIRRIVLSGRSTFWCPKCQT